MFAAMRQAQGKTDAILESAVLGKIRGTSLLVLQQAQYDVRKLIAGPRLSICDECVAICDSIVAGDEKKQIANAVAAGSALECLVCKSTKPSTALIHVPNRGPVCSVCIATIKVAAGKKWDFRDESSGC